MPYAFEKGKFTEAELEEAILSLFQEQGWDYAYGEDIKRTESDKSNYEEVLLRPEIKAFLRRRYQAEQLTENELDRIIMTFSGEATANLFQASRATFRHFVDGFTFQRDNPAEPSVFIQLVDFVHPESNHLQIVNQFTVVGTQERRPDALLFLNGVPFCICEFKSAIAEDATLYNAWEQVVKRYVRDIPELMKYTSLVLLCDGANTKLGTVFTPYEYFYAWKKVNADDRPAEGISSLETMIAGAFSPKRILSILQNFVYYADGATTQREMVCRYPQYFGAQKMLASIRTALRPAGDGKGGTYFGATGCGKTMMMVFLARLLKRTNINVFHNPTIIVIVDRDDLSNQSEHVFTPAKTFLGDDCIKVIDSRQDLLRELAGRTAGGVFITTIQKFCEEIGLLSDRNNIICFSDEAHRTQAQLGSKLIKTDEGVRTAYGYAVYLRQSFPQATYTGFSGTPKDETIYAFGDVVTSYTMKESSDDGITARLSYEPRIARVNLSDEDAKKIEAYYQQCAKIGATPEQIAKSKKMMSQMTIILGHPERLQKLAKDMIRHYERLCDEKPAVVQKAMIVCADRKIAFRLLQEIVRLRPEWLEAKKMPNEAEKHAKIAKIEDEATRKEAENKLQQKLSALRPLPRINLVATQGVNDEKDLYEACGNKTYRKMLERNFKDDASNFQIAVVVDMWLTGFDVPSLAVMYIDKPLQAHNLIQTISRVNRIYPGKEKGLIVDYIGIKEELEQALKKYGGPTESPVDKLETSLEILRNQLDLLKQLFITFDAQPYFSGTPLERLRCLDNASQFIMKKKAVEDRFMGITRRLRMAYDIVNPSGRLTEEEMNLSQFYLAVRSIIAKMTRGNAPDTAMMNRRVEKMVEQALEFTGIATLVAVSPSIDVDSPEFQQEIDAVKMPLTRFLALIRLLRRAIGEYGKTNRIKAREFDKMLREIVEKYNHRDDAVYSTFTDFVNDLSDEVLNVMHKMKEDKDSFQQEGITFEEKAFMDILIKVRDEHGFTYPDERCKDLAKEIKKLVANKLDYVGWNTRDDIKASLMVGLIELLYDNGYPPEWKDEVFQEVWGQAENFKKYHG